MNFLSLLAQRKEAKERAPRRGVQSFMVSTLRLSSAFSAGKLRVPLSGAGDRASLRGLCYVTLNILFSANRFRFSNARDCRGVVNININEFAIERATIPHDAGPTTAGDGVVQIFIGSFNGVDDFC